MSQAHRRGRPVVVMHGLANILVTAAALHEWGVERGERLWSAGDASWLAVQVHGIYGPLSRGITTVLYEGTLDVPTHGRAWDHAPPRGDDDDDDPVRAADHARMGAGSRTRARSSRCGVVLYAEPSEPAPREWGGLPTSATAPSSPRTGGGQVELGGIVHLSQPLDPDLVLSVEPAIVDASGQPVPDGEAGELVLTKGGPAAAARVLRASTDHHGRSGPGYTTGTAAAHRGDPARPAPTRPTAFSGQLVSISEWERSSATFVERTDVIERRDVQGGR